MSPTPHLSKYIKSITYCTRILTSLLMLCTDASQALPPARQMRFRGSSCTCLSPLCRCSPGHTWHSPGGSKDSSLEGSEDRRVSLGATSPSSHLLSRHLVKAEHATGRSPRKQETWDRSLWGVRARGDLGRHQGFARCSERGRGLLKVIGQWQIKTKTQSS